MRPENAVYRDSSNAAVSIGMNMPQAKFVEQPVISRRSSEAEKVFGHNPT
jgi:hypothetical protein